MATFKYNILFSIYLNKTNAFGLPILRCLISFFYFLGWIRTYIFLSLSLPWGISLSKAKSKPRCIEDKQEVISFENASQVETITTGRKNYHRLKLFTKEMPSCLSTICNVVKYLEGIYVIFITSASLTWNLW